MKLRAALIALSMIITASALTSCGASDEASSNAVGREERKSSSAEKKAEKADTEEAAVENAEDFDYDDADDDFVYDMEAAEYSAAGDVLSGDSEDVKSADGDVSEPEPAPDTDVTDIDTSEPFVLTAGEWNDNLNWGFFANIVNSELISFPSFGLDPTRRVAVTATNAGEPVRGLAVELIDSDENVVWSAVTDKSGAAYLFCTADGSYTVKADGSEVPVEIKLSGSDQSESLAANAEAVIETDTASAAHEKTEVMFILDTTGSMADEIAYLQKDFASIAEEVSGENVTFSVNFYRDEGDDYVTKCNPFTNDVKEVQSLLNKEYADGGGDTPEAVADILDETITNGEWSDDTNKIAFLIFDAPPHDGTEKTVTEAVRAAAEKGINLVPVVSSNSDRDTEVFGRALAMMTGSNYVFLTDDSGVGGSHLEPIIGDYDVELLHDIIVRNILGIIE